MDEKDDVSETAEKPEGSITRLPKGALAPNGRTQRAKRTGTTVKEATTPKKTRGRRTGVTVGAPKRPYTRRIQPTSTASPISALLRANGFTSAATVEVHEGRKRLSIPVSLLP